MSTAQTHSLSLTGRVRRQEFYDARHVMIPGWLWGGPLQMKILLLLSLFCAAVFAAEMPRSGTNFIHTQVYSEADDAKLLKAFEGLRVADVSDGMDAVGLQNTGLMNPEIHPLWRDAKEFKHRFHRHCRYCALCSQSETASGQNGNGRLR